MDKPNNVRKGQRPSARNTNKSFTLARALANVRGGPGIRTKLEESGLIISAESDEFINDDVKIELAKIDATDQTPYEDERYWVRPIGMKSDDSTDWINIQPETFDSPDRLSEQYTATNIVEIAEGTHDLPQGLPIIVVYTRDMLDQTNRHLRVFSANKIFEFPSGGEKGMPFIRGEDELITYDNGIDMTNAEIGDTVTDGTWTGEVTTVPTGDVIGSFTANTVLGGTPANDDAITLGGTETADINGTPVITETVVLDWLRIHG